MKLLTVVQAAEMVGVKPRQVRHWIDIGFLPVTPIGSSKFVNEETFLRVLKDAEKRRDPETVP